MPKPRLIAAALAATLLFPAVAGATATEAVRSAASTTVRAVEKAGDAVVHGVGVAADTVEHGFKKAGEGVNHAKKKLGLPATEPGPAPVNSAAPTPVEGRPAP